MAHTEPDRLKILKLPVKGIHLNLGQVCYCKDEEKEIYMVGMAVPIVLEQAEYDKVTMKLVALTHWIN